MPPDPTDLPPPLTPAMQAQLSALHDLPAAAQTGALARLLDDHPACADQLRALFLLGGSPTSRRPPDMPQHIGPYRLMRRLGEGGMGSVYLAVQERPIRRAVALKLMRPGRGSDEAMLRFAAERQVLALLDHPAIARVLDSGTTDDGRPFFAMDHVPGEPITDYCKRVGLSLDARLRLFVEVCRGVHHAHLRGIIHRDLKPSNVMVQEHEDRVVPKIIDFGIAKVADHKLVDATLHTELGRIIGTPEYMSPEQADPKTAVVDVRSDIYSLGVMLYELLTGELPLPSAELRALTLPAMVLRIREYRPPRPSARVVTVDSDPATTPGTAAWIRRIRGDLDWVTLRALEKDPERRYQSAAALADDVVRFLELRPVDAGPPSALYRMRRFVRRHRVPVIAAAAVLVSVVGGAIGMGLLAARSARHAAAASRHATQAEDLASFMMFDLRDRLRPLGRLDVLEAVAGKAQAYYDAREETELSAPAGLGLAVALRNLAEVLQAQGKLVDALALQDRARALVEGFGGSPIALSACDVARAGLLCDSGMLEQAAAAAAGAVELAEAASDGEPGRDFAIAAAHESRARTHRATGNLVAARVDWVDAVAAFTRAGDAHTDRRVTAILGLAELEGAQGHTEAACRGHDSARQLVEAHLQADPGNGRMRFLLAHVATRDGGVLAAAGRCREAVVKYQDAERTLTSLVDRDPGNNDWRAELAMTRARLGEACLGDGDSNGAADAYRAAVELGRGLLRQRPDHAEWRASLGDCLFHLAQITRHRGDVAAARTLMEEAEGHAEAVTAQDPQHAEWQRLLGVTRYELARMASIDDRKTDALAYYRRAAETQAALAARDPSAVAWQADLANSHLGVGAMASACGDFARADAAFDEARLTLRRLLELQPAELTWLRHLAACEQLSARAAHRRGDLTTAFARDSQVIALRREVVARAPDNPSLQRELAVALLGWSDRLVEEGSTAAAVTAATEAVETLAAICERDPGNASWRSLLGKGHTRVGYAHQAGGDRRAALAAFARALELNEQLLSRDPDNPEWRRAVAASAHLVAEEHYEQGEAEPALRGFERADALFRVRAEALPEDRIAACDVAINAGCLGRTLEMLGRHAQARDHFVRAAATGAPVIDAMPSFRAEQVAFFHLAAARAGLRAGSTVEWVEAAVDKGSEWLGQSDATSAAGQAASQLQRALRIFLTAAESSTADDQLALAELLRDLGRPLESVAAYTRALTDDGLRHDLRRGALFAAARVAAQALGAANDTVGFLQQALAWLDEDLSLRRARLVAVEDELAAADQQARTELEAERRALVEHFASVARDDPGLTTLRREPGFASLLERHALDAGAGK